MNQKKQRGKTRQLILIATALIVIPGTFGYIEFWLSRPIGEGPAGPEVDRTHFEKVWSDRTVRVVGIGDSITAGLGAKSPKHTFFNRLIQNPSDEYEPMRGVCLSSVLPSLSAENFAISGSESNVHLDVIRETLPTYPDDFAIILMTSGGNDLIHSYGRSPPRECAMYSATLEQAKPWIENFRDRLDTMFREIAAKFPAGCEIYIGDIYDPTDGVGDAPSIFLPDWPDGLSIHARYNQVIRDVASQYEFAHVVPLHETFLGHGSHCRQFWRSNYDSDDPHYWFFTNIEDPNDRGYDAIRRVFLNTILAKTTLKSKRGKGVTM
ncbi:MAG: SGNH/GDSL hydrolase family protein [Phycisphaera sp. RhM]|nr:SGNH/GDSL hydrolase family protein [Phycisphaera sp. RhM]